MSGLGQGQTASLGGIYNFGSGVKVTFATDAPAAFFYESTAFTEDIIVDGLSYAFNLELHRLDVPAAIISETMSIEEINGQTFTRGGVMPAGTYELFLGFGVFSDSGIDIDYDTTFALAPTTPIPLPPMVWGALTLLGGAVVTTRKARRID